MIPKKIHYCWVGNKKLPDFALNCIQSWKRYLPDYEIIRWDESNYDFTKNQYMKQAFEAKKWGFVPDYARLDIVYQFGGIYLDVDVEVIASFDDLLSNIAFCGQEADNRIALGLGFGAEKNCQIIKQLRDFYDDKHFVNSDNTFNLTPAPDYHTNFFLQKGYVKENKIQQISQMTIYPVDFFCPLLCGQVKPKISVNTKSIHHYAGTWVPGSKKIKTRLLKLANKILPNSFVCILKNIFKWNSKK